MSITTIKNLISLRVLTITFVAITLVACGSDNLGDLRDYVADVKSRKKARIQPLPELKPHETFFYEASNRRDPFEEALTAQPETLAKTTSNGNAKGLRPDANRRKEALEEFPLDTLRMVGSLEQKSSMWAIIKASDGTVHRVKTGNYVGQNHGKITQVREDEIKLLEIAPDGLGGWIERDASLALSE
ncbi:MAG: pilus assembly protein PilP [Gammaproteobacteria bacterium]|nr:pilus assembly protein PilP [Gammaproteobacteria bacterium]MDH5593641.1 pilus assembly protein PilP [Gammaproteobacteria bacterium]